MSLGKRATVAVLAVGMAAIVAGFFGVLFSTVGGWLFLVAGTAYMVAGVILVGTFCVVAVREDWQ